MCATWRMDWRGASARGRDKMGGVPVRWCWLDQGVALREIRGQRSILETRLMGAVQGLDVWVNNREKSICSGWVGIWLLELWVKIGEETACIHMVWLECVCESLGYEWGGDIRVQNTFLVSMALWACVVKSLKLKTNASGKANRISTFFSESNFLSICTWHKLHG